MLVTKKGKVELCVFCHEKINIEKNLKVKNYRFSIWYPELVDLMEPSW